jgi:enoyl reductase-like protein
MNEVIQRIRLLGQYAWGYGLRVRLEVLYAIESLIAGRWKHGSRFEDLTSAAHIVIVETLPLPPWLEKRTEQLNPAEREIVDTALRLGFEISANAAHVLESLPSVDDGYDVMAKILRHAVIVHDESLRAAAIQQFQHAMEDAFADGRRWLEFAMNNALRPLGSDQLQMPKSLADKMWPSH